jgi:hypothetical protein
MLDQDKSLHTKNMESLILRLNTAASKQGKFADNLIFWVAHAKLMRQLNKKMKVLTGLLAKDK